MKGKKQEREEILSKFLDRTLCNRDTNNELKSVNSLKIRMAPVSKETIPPSNWVTSMEFIKQIGTIWNSPENRGWELPTQEKEIPLNKILSEIAKHGRIYLNNSIFEKFKLRMDLFNHYKFHKN